MPDKSVFVVDDDAAVRQGLRFMLRAAGYSVEAFPSALSNFPFGERRIGEFGRKARDAPDRRAGAICQQFTHAHA